ncbi:MAG: hypothetical protein IKS28_07700 [Clostridia bacterium]|nr:hypothetical protein [Clostridia bacterium]
MKKTFLLTMLALMIAVIMTIGASAKELVIWAADELGTDWGAGGPTLEPGKVGNAHGGSLDSLSMGAVVLCHRFENTAIDPSDPTAPSIDISEYVNNPDAYIHFWYYIDDIDEVAVEADDQAFLQISSDGFANGRSWGLSGCNLKSGWNEITLPCSSLGGGNADLTRITCLRLVQYGYTFTAMIDDVKLVIPEAGEENPGVTPPTADYISAAVACAVVAGAALVFTKKKAR